MDKTITNNEEIMKKIGIYLLSIFILGYITGCVQFEEYQSVEVLTKPNVSLLVTDVADSSFVMDFSTDKAGRVGFVLLGDTAVDVAAISILSHSLADNVATLILQTYSTDGPGGDQFDISGLMPNSYYKVAVAASNTDGVESGVKSFILKTDDNVEPSFESSNPVISDVDNVLVGSDIVLTFDEPVKVNPEKKFIFTYYFAGEVAEIMLNNSNVSGNTVTVPQPMEGHNGDYFFLSWEAGAVTDLSGNPCEERVSGVVNGILVGNYYRFEKVSFSVSDKTVLPESGSAISDDAIEISFPFAISLSDNLVANMIRFKYTSWDGLVATEVSASANCEIVNDTILRITQPRSPSPGDKIELYIDEGIITDTYGNPNSASEYDFNWNYPRLTIDDVLGDYIVTGVSYYYETVVTDTVSIELNPDEPNSVIITGLFRNLLGSSEPVDGTFDAANSQILIDEQIIGSDDQYYYTAYSPLTADLNYLIRVMILDGGIMSSDLALGVYDKSFEFLGDGEYLPEVTWTKMGEEKSAQLNHYSNSGVSNKISIWKISKGMK